MTTSARAALSPSKQRKKAVPRAKTVRAKSAVGQRAKQSATSVAIATELAPAVAIALLDKTEQPPGAAAPALDCLAAGAAPSETDGKIRVQLMFENGAVLPVEMSNAAGAALSKGLAEELPKK
jgi:D-aminopeptidase